MKYNYPLLAMFVGGGIVWLLVIAALYMSAGCSADAPC